MEAILAVMEKLISESASQNRVFKRNILKDYLQILVYDITCFVKKKFGIDIKTSVQKFRIYLKFPILVKLGLAGTYEYSDPKPIDKSPQTI